MEHKGTINIETDRLLLRRFVIEDAFAMFKTWANDSDVTTYLTWQPHGNIEVTTEILKTWLRGYDDAKTYNWAITLKEKGRAIGSIAVVDFSFEYDRCEVGYCIGKDYWGKGIMTEALSGVLRYLLKTVGFNRVQAYCHIENTASGKVMQKAGMNYEGCLREYVKNKQGLYVDCDLYSMLKSDLDGII